MSRRLVIRITQLVVVLACALGMKFYYSTATVDELRWILAPTTFVVEIVTGSQFAFEAHAGYMKNDHTFLIAASCAGVNFLITAFLMLALSQLWKNRSSECGRDLKQIFTDWSFLPVAALSAYLTTIIANTIRISTALLHHSSKDATWLDREQLHRVEGIVVYFGVLLALFMLTEGISSRTGSGRMLRHDRSRNITRPYIIPLVIYYATTLGVPILNGATQRTDFWEHASFVLLMPLLLIGLVFAFHISLRRVSD